MFTFCRLNSLLTEFDRNKLDPLHDYHSAKFSGKNFQAFQALNFQAFRKKHLKKNQVNEGVCSCLYFLKNFRICGDYQSYLSQSTT